MDDIISGSCSSVQIKITCGNFTIRYDIYLLLLGFHPEAVALTLLHKRQITVIYRRRNNTVHRTHKTESKTYKTIKQNLKRIITT